MKILFVLEHFYPFVGGVTVLFEELATRLVKNHTLMAIATRLPNNALIENWRGITIRRVATPPFSRRYWFTCLALPTIFKHARSADLIHTTTYNAALPAFLAGKLLRKPVVVTVHEVWGRRWFHYDLTFPLALIYFLIEQLILRLPFDQFIAVSQATSRDLIALRGAKKKVRIIHNGIDEKLFAPTRYHHEHEKNRLGYARKFLFLYFGRPGISKGVSLLIDAMQTQPVKAHLLLILGQDPKAGYRAIEQQIQRLGLQTKITLRPPLPRARLPRILASADCVVVPSLAEGFGFSAAEACAMDRPIIASRAGSLPEVVSGKVIFFETGNSQALARALKLAQRNKFDKIKRRSFSWDASVASHLMLYSELIA
ncbi:glycosyltransferase family 4 protein [Candidatus Berkelbacteria bacterium]|nr:glycosyltransferase family 4 protein [Candidatus Berkelbacteria bacterium]